MRRPVSLSFKEDKDSFVEISRFDLGEGNQAMIETNNLFVYQHFIFCTPLIGQFRICNLKHPQAPIILTSANPTSESPSPQMKNSISQTQSDSLSLSSDVSKTSSKKPSLVNRFVANLKSSLKKVNSMISSPKKEPVPSSVYYTDEALIDDLIVLSGKEMTPDGTTYLQLLIVGRFSNHIAKLFLDVQIDPDSFKIVSNTIAKFNLSPLTEDADEEEVLYLIRSSTNNGSGSSAQKVGIFEIQQDKVAVYGVSKGINPEILFSIPVSNLAPSKRHISVLKESTLAQYSMGEVKIANFDHVGGCKWVSVAKVDYDIALMHCADDGLIVLSTFNEIFVLDCTPFLAPLSKDQKSLRVDPKKIEPAIQLHNLVIKTVAC